MKYNLTLTDIMACIVHTVPCKFTLLSTLTGTDYILVIESQLRAKLLPSTSIHQ